jgi:3-phytase
VTTVYGIDGKDYMLTIAMPDSVFRAFELPSLEQVEGFAPVQLGDWSSLCSWTSPSRNQYLYMFGKKQGVQYLVRANGSLPELVEVSCDVDC